MNPFKTKREGRWQTKTNGIFSYFLNIANAAVAGFITAKYTLGLDPGLRQFKLEKIVQLEYPLQKRIIRHIFQRVTIRSFQLTALFAIVAFLRSCSGSSFFFTYGYNISKGHVFYKQPYPQPVIDMKEVDVQSFREIHRKADSVYADNGYFAVDKRAVYYQGYEISGSDGPSFQLIDINFSRDKSQCYYRGTRIPGADPSTFRVRDENFSLDHGHIFRRHLLIDNDTTIFESFDNSDIVRTANAVSVYDEVVPIPPGSIFHYLGHNYFAVDAQAYWNYQPLPGHDTAGFKAMTDYYATTLRHVYYGKKEVEGADPSTFTLLDAPFSRDRMHVFFSETMIDGADPKSFVVLNAKFQCSRDKKQAFHEEKPITKFTVSDLLNQNTCTNCSDSAIYFGD